MDCDERSSCWAVTSCFLQAFKMQSLWNFVKVDFEKIWIFFAISTLRIRDANSFICCKLYILLNWDTEYYYTTFINISLSSSNFFKNFANFLYHPEQNYLNKGHFQGKIRFRPCYLCTDIHLVQSSKVSVLQLASIALFAIKQNLAISGGLKIWVYKKSINWDSNHSHIYVGSYDYD